MLLELARHDGGIEHVRVTPERWRGNLTRTDVVVFVAVCDGVPVGYVSAVRTPYLWGGGDCSRWTTCTCVSRLATWGSAPG